MTSYFENVIILLRSIDRIQKRKRKKMENETENKNETTISLVIKAFDALRVVAEANAKIQEEMSDFQAYWYQIGLVDAYKLASEIVAVASKK